MADAKKPNRLPKDFDQMNPNIEITNPGGAEDVGAGIPLDREYPKHVHKFSGVGLPFEYVVVHDAQSEAAAKRKGFGSVRDANAAHRDAVAALEDDAAKPKKPAKVVN